jgi:hypothetical protein
MTKNNFSSHAKNIRIFENPFALRTSDVPEGQQLELIALQYDSFLRSSFNQESLIALHGSLPVGQFPFFSCVNTKFGKYIL